MTLIKDCVPGGNLNHELYYTWKEMKQRCHNKKNKCYHLYGARGITVCERWRYSFLTFVKDLGPKPSKKHSLDRIDNNKGYSKENCRWATPSEQVRNRRSSNLKNVNGVLREHCHKGHPWRKETTQITSNGKGMSRRCLICLNNRLKNKKSEALAQGKEE